MRVDAISNTDNHVEIVIGYIIFFPIKGVVAEYATTESAFNSPDSNTCLMCREMVDVKVIS